MTRLATIAAFGAALVVATQAHAQPIRPFTPAAFAAAQKAGQPVLVDVHADWCPTCRAQDPTVAEISRDPAYANLVIFKLDYDTQANDWRALRVSHQSTLIAYHGGAERARAAGIVARDAIRALASTALR